MAAPDGSIIIDTRINADGARRGVQEVQSAMGRLAGTVKKVGTIIFTAFAIKQLVIFGKECTKLGSDLEEVENVVNVTFPKMTEKVNDFALSAADAFGLSETMAKQYIGTFGAMAKSFGYTEESAYDMAASLTALTGDVASFYNLSQKESYTKLKSVFTGETETLKDLGVVMTQSALDQYALANGYGKTTAKMTEQEKVALRLKFVQEKLSAASGDFARSSDSWANQIRIMQLRLESLKATIGQGLINIFTPVIKAINIFLAKLSVATNAFKDFTELLAGKKSVDNGKNSDATKTLNSIQTGYEGAAEGAEDFTDATKEATKQSKKLLAPFDEIVKLQGEAKENNSGSNVNIGNIGLPPELSGESVFLESPFLNNILDTLENIKKTLFDFFNPFKESWNDSGSAVLESMKNVFASAKKLASDVGASFMQVWNVEGYGKKITDDLLITFANLAQTVANLITQFDKAWNSGNTGTNILRHLGDIILEITGFFRQASESLKNWAADLDFSPLLMAFDRVLVAIKPIVADVGNAILWLLDNVLLPVTKWGIEQALPEVFNLIAAALKVFHSVIQALKPLALWLWESYLKPFGEWSGKVIISALKKITELLTKFSDWIRENQEIIQGVTILVLEFFAAWKTIQLLSFIQQSGGVIEALKRITTAIMGSTLAKTKDIAETAILNAMYAKDFVVSMGKAAAAILKANANFILFTASITAIIGLIVVLAKNWNKMSPTEKVISSILAAAAAVGVLAVALGAVKGAAGAALVAAALAAGIAAATIAINAGKRQVSSYQSAGRSMSGREYAPAAAYMAVPYRMPRLATGTVVPPRAGEFAAILGDNKRETEVVSPLSTMKQALLEALQEAGIGGENKTAGPIYMEIDGKVFARMINPYMESEKSRIGVRMVNT